MLGSRDEYILIRFERFAPSDSIQVVASGNPLQSLISFRKLSIVYGDGGFVHVTGFRDGSQEDGTPNIFVTRSRLTEFPAESPAQPRVPPAMEAAITGITLRWSNRKYDLKTAR